MSDLQNGVLEPVAGLPALAPSARPAERPWHRHRRVRYAAPIIATIVAILIAWTQQEASSNGGAGATLLVLLVFFAAAACEFIDSSLGMGYGTTLTPVLLLAGFPPERIVPAVLLSELLTGMAAAAMHHRDGNVDWLRDRRCRQTVVILSALTLIGAAAAALVSVGMSARWLTAAIACIVLAMAVLMLATRGRRLEWRAGRVAAVGLAAAFCKGLSGGGYGPLVTAGQMVSGVPARAAVAVTSAAEAWACLVALIALAAAGRSIDGSLAAPLAAGALCSVPLATLMVRRCSEARLRGAVALAAGVLGVAALVKAVV